MIAASNSFTFETNRFFTKVVGESFTYALIDSSFHLDRTTLELKLTDQHAIVLKSLQVEEDLKIQAASVLVLHSIDAKNLIIETSGNVFFLGDVTVQQDRRIPDNKLYLRGAHPEKLHKIRKLFLQSIEEQNGALFQRAIEQINALILPLIRVKIFL